MTLKRTPLRHSVLKSLWNGRVCRSSTPAQVQRATNSFYEDGLITRSAENGITLTDKGEQVFSDWNAKYGQVSR